MFRFERIHCETFDSYTETTRRCCCVAATCWRGAHLLLLFSTYYILHLLRLFVAVHQECMSIKSMKHKPHQQVTISTQRGIIFHVLH